MDISIIFIILQTFLGFLVTMIGIILAVIIFRRDPTYALNKLFAIGLVCLGLAMFFFSFGNVPYLVFGEQTSNASIVVLSMQIFLTFLSFSLASFLLASIVLLYGSTYAFSYRVYPYLIIYLGLSIIVTWFTNSIILVGLQGDITVGFYVTIIIFPLIVALYLIIMYFFREVYQQTEGIIKQQMKMFLFGWILAGLAILLAGLSNFLPTGRILDITAPTVLSISIIVLFQGFTHKADLSRKS